MMRNSWRVSAGSSGNGALCAVAADPLIDVSGARSSWLTIPRNSARSVSIFSSGVMSWMVADDRLDRAVVGVDRRGVDERGDMPAVGALDDHLLGPNKLPHDRSAHHRMVLTGDL